MASLSVVIVAHNSAADLARSLPALADELKAGDEVVIVDNASDDDLAGVVKETLPAATILAMGSNAGFAAAINHGSAVTNGDLLLILNPDAKVEPGFGDAIRKPIDEHPDWAAWMGLVACHEGGKLVVNSWGNPVHFTGIVWAGGHGQPLGEVGPAGEVPTASGACLAVRPESWKRIRGFSERFFLYHEDVDLSIRLRIAGEKVGIEPSAVVDHEYEFSGNELKWFWLERNRWAFIIRCYPTSLLLLLMPALLATEIALVAAAAKGGWLGAKLRSWVAVLAWLPGLRHERRYIQARRAISDREFANWLTPDIDSPFLPEAVSGGPIRKALRAYWRAVLVVLPK